MIDKLGVNRADKQRAYLLHRRSYSETSLIGYFFTRNYGIVHILALGAKRKKGDYALLQPTMELSLSWSGKSDLKTMRMVELSHRHNLYSGKSLTILMYINEMLVKLLKPFDSHKLLYDNYHNFLLCESQSSQGAKLRKFELELFAELGYGVSWDKDYKTAEPITDGRNYVYEPAHGFTSVLATQVANSFNGTDLLQMRDGDYSKPEVEQAGKQLSRLIIHHLLENKSLSSRKLIINSRTKIT